MLSADQIDALRESARELTDPITAYLLRDIARRIAEAGAPDHEPIQGRQYSDAVYTVLNASLRRRIGTLNCGHAAFPSSWG